MWGWGGGTAETFFVRAGLSVALLLFDPFLFAAFLFPPQEYPGMVWILFVEPPFCLSGFWTPQSEGNIIHELRLGWGPWEPLSFLGRAPSSEG